MKKLLLCVGAAKTGTTWLYKNIERNQGVWFTPEKELNYFFSRHGWFDRLTPKHRGEKRAKFEARGRHGVQVFDDRLAWYRRYEAGAVSPGWYRGLFSETPADVWACDFSPSTSLISPQGWTEVAGFAPEIRLIYILREPRERLWSHAKFHAAYTDRIDEFGAMSVSAMNEFIEKANLGVDGDYGTHLEGIYKKIPRENVLLIDFARIAAEPDAVLREVEAFAGLPKTRKRRDKLAERVNTSPPIPMPAKFGDAYRERFARECGLLVRLGVDFARPWRDAAGGKPTRLRDLAARVIRR